MIPSKTRFTGLSFAGGQLSLTICLKATQAILRAKTPAFPSKKVTLPDEIFGQGVSLFNVYDESAASMISADSSLTSLH